MNSLILSSLPALLLGLASTAHCGLMCGGISVMFSTAKNAPLGLVHAGRISGYVGAGIIAHVFMSFTVWIAVPPDPRLLIGVNGVILFIIGTQILPGSLLKFRFLNKMGIYVWQTLQKGIRPALAHVPTKIAPYVKGLAWGFLPCSMVYSAILLAIAQASFLGAMGIMLLFGIGTLPGLFAVTAVSRRVEMIMAVPAARYWTGGFLLLWGVVIIAMFFATSGGESFHHHA